jgi:hypothetical protein
LNLNGTFRADGTYVSITIRDNIMKKSALLILAVLAMPLTAQAQGVVGGAQEGAEQGNHAAGPVGGVVGGAVGGVVGGVEGGVKGVLGIPQHHYRHCWWRHGYRHCNWR